MLEAKAIGRLTADPKIQKRTKGDTEYKVCEFRLACQQRKDKVDFIKVTAWSGMGNFLFKALRKGEKIYVEGSLHIPPFDREKGRSYDPYLVADKFEFCGDKEKGLSSLSAEGTSSGNADTLQEDDLIPEAKENI